jgi:O-acetyl-ADP-ribose deacetylase (regulator of RNase III)
MDSKKRALAPSSSSLDKPEKKRKIESLLKNDDEGDEKKRSNIGGKQHQPPPKKIIAKHNIREVKDDLFNCPSDASMAHCVSQCFTMGAGVALKFAKAFEHKEELRDQKTKIGGVAYLGITNPDGKMRYIYYLVTKKIFSDKPTFQSLKQSCLLLRDHVVKNKVAHLCIPQIGCGLDRLDWNKDVKPMLYDLFGSLPGVQLTIYSL